MAQGREESRAGKAVEIILPEEDYADLFLMEMDY